MAKAANTTATKNGATNCFENNPPGKFAQYGSGNLRLPVTACLINTARRPDGTHRGGAGQSRLHSLGVEDAISSVGLELRQYRAINGRFLGERLADVRIGLSRNESARSQCGPGPSAVRKVHD